jgi:endonuclease/exonuclease/phosphatase family metal-dependent hydrolase
MGWAAFGWSFAVALVGMFATAAQSAEPLRVMSFNIRGDFDLEKATDSSEAWNSLSNAHRRDMVTKTIAEFRPDLLGVQEAYTHQLVDMQKALTGYEFYGVGRDDGKQAGEHSAIYFLTERWEPKMQGTFWLSETPDEAGTRHPDAACNRVATWLVLADKTDGGKEYFVLNTHFDHISRAARDFAAALIRERLKVLAVGRPVIVMGDLNAREENNALAILRGDTKADLPLLDSYREVVPQRGVQEATFHNFGGATAGPRIDFILHTGDLRTVEAGIDHTKFGDRYPSDHFPITAVFEPASEKAAGDATAPR